MLEYHIIKLGERNNEYAPGKTIAYNLNSSIVLIEAEKHKIIIDPGSSNDTQLLLSKLKELKILPEEIDFVINTHWHFDHSYNNFLFKNAKIFIDKFIWDLKNKTCTIFKDPNLIKIPFIEFIPTPGHTVDHHSVLFKYKDKKIIVAGDAIRERHIRNMKFPKHYSNKEDYIKSINKILSIADIIIPGHGRIIEGEILKELQEMITKNKWRVE